MVSIQDPPKKPSDSYDRDSVPTYSTRFISEKAKLATGRDVFAQGLPIKSFSGGKRRKYTEQQDSAVTCC